MKFRVPSSEFGVDSGVFPSGGAETVSGTPSELGTRNSELSVVHVASGREWRGGQRQVCYLASALAEAGGIRQLVVTGRGTRLAAELGRSGVPVSAVPWGPAFDPRVLWRLIRELDGRRAERPILHAHDAHAFTLAALAAAWRGAPVVVTRRVELLVRHPSLWRRADRVVAISEAVGRVAGASGLDPGRVVVVPSGIPLDVPSAVTPLDLRLRLQLANEAILAVTVGALEAEKDHRTLVAAAARLRVALPSLHWVIAGTGALRPELERRIAVETLGDRVHLIGEVPDGRAVIAAADLFVACSRQEGLNTSVLDAMALGVPVVSSDAGGLPEVLAGDAGVLFQRENPAALAAAVARVVGDPSPRRRLVATARERVRRFGSDRMAAGMLSVYHSVARTT
jgi:glycosyltransferase involved in cell wall biosynthesis